MLWLLGYASVAVLVWLIASTEVYASLNRGLGGDFTDFAYSTMMAGPLLGALWPATVPLYVLYTVSRGGFYRPHSGLMCRLTGGHRWSPGPGGITFQGKQAIFTDGAQRQSCSRCWRERHVWPWGDEQFGAHETFGYRSRG